MLQAVHRSTAAICRQHPGRKITKGTVLHGATHSSKTMPNSVSACASPSTSSANLQQSCCTPCVIKSAVNVSKHCSMPINRAKQEFMINVNGSQNCASSCQK